MVLAREGRRIAGFLVALLIPKENPSACRFWAVAISFVTFLVSLGLIGPAMSGSAGKFVLETDSPWIDTPAIRYHVAIDGVSLWLVILSTLLTPICVLISWRYIDKHIKAFYALMLLLEFGLVGVNGVDFVMSRGRPIPIEVNPRYTAAMELAERLYGISIARVHAEACAGKLPSFAPEPRRTTVRGAADSRPPRPRVGWRRLSFREVGEG